MRLFSLVCAGLIVISGHASAALIVSNTGPLAEPASFRIGGPNSQVEAVIWEQDAETTDSIITATIGSADDSAHTVDVYLVFNDQRNLIASTTVSVSAFGSVSAFTPVTLFSGLDLKVGAYALFLFNSDTTGSVNVRWAVGSTTNDVSTDPTLLGLFDGSGFSNTVTSGTSTNVEKPYLSNLQLSNAKLEFSVSGTIVTPEPSTLALAAMGGLGIAIRGIRRRRSA